MSSKDKVEVLKSMIWTININFGWWIDPPDEATQDKLNEREALEWAVKRLEKMV